MSCNNVLGQINHNELLWKTPTPVSNSFSTANLFHEINSMAFRHIRVFFFKLTLNLFSTQLLVQSCFTACWAAIAFCVV